MHKYGTRTRQQQQWWQQQTNNLTIQTGTTSTPRRQLHEDHRDTRGPSAPIRGSSCGAEGCTDHSALRRTSIHNNSKNIQQEDSTRHLQAHHGGANHRQTAGTAVLSLAPELRMQNADATVKHHITREVAQTLLEDTQEPTEEEMYLEDLQLSHMPAAFASTTWRLEQPSATSLNTIHPIQAAQEEVEVAAESNTLCAILPLVDGKERVEAILNPGCQVVAMSEEVCNALTLPYNLDICLNMVSANSRVDQSLRVAQNITFFSQGHNHIPTGPHTLVACI